MRRIRIVSTRLIVLTIILGWPSDSVRTCTKQIAQSEWPIIARVLSTNPFSVEPVEDPKNPGGAVHAPRPVNRDIKHSAEEVKHLRYGDIISADVYSYFSGGDELGLGTGFRNIRRLGAIAKQKYENTGFLICYTPVRSGSGSYVTIYRDGTVLCQDTPGNYITNRTLSAGELKKLSLVYFSEHIDLLPSVETLKEYDPTVVLSFGKYQRLDVASPTANLKRFLSRLDSMFEEYIQSATYRISYYRRFLVKDWAYQEIIPIDETDDYTAYRYKHRERLSQIRPSPSFLKEAAASCQESCALYRYKGNIYGFEFANCSDGTTGTLACFQAYEVPFGTISKQTNWGYMGWPDELGARLSNVPVEGLDIPADEYLKHREVYTALLRGSRFLYKEGDYIYQGVNTRYH